MTFVFDIFQPDSNLNLYYTINQLITQSFSLTISNSFDGLRNRSPFPFHSNLGLNKSREVLGIYFTQREGKLKLGFIGGLALLIQGVTLGGREPQKLKFTSVFGTFPIQWKAQGITHIIHNTTAPEGNFKYPKRFYKMRFFFFVSFFFTTFFEKLIYINNNVWANPY